MKNFNTYKIEYIYDIGNFLEQKCIIKCTVGYINIDSMMFH